MNLANQDICQVIYSLGGLHDAELLSFSWRPIAKQCVLQVDDLYANTRGLAEYPGKTSAEFIIAGIALLNVEMDFTVGGLVIFEWSMTRISEREITSEIAFSPGGQVRFSCQYVEIREHLS
jgi:hypothetical protein